MLSPYFITSIARVLTTKDAAQRLHVSARHVRRLVHNGRLRGAMFGRSLLAVDKSDVARLAKRRA